MLTAARFASALAILVIAPPAFASEGRTFTYTRTLDRHDEYIVDACNLTVRNAAGEVEYSAFAGEFGFGTVCDGFTLDASSQFVVRANRSAGFECVQSKSNTLAPAAYCAL